MSKLRTLVSLVVASPLALSLTAASGAPSHANGDTARATSANAKKIICTVDSDPDGPCGNRTTTPLPVEHDYVEPKEITFQTANLYFSTLNGPRKVRVVVGAGTAAPASPTSAPAVDDVLVDEPSLVDHAFQILHLEECRHYWYGLYVDDALVKDGSFDTPGVYVTSPVTVTPYAVRYLFANDRVVDRVGVALSVTTSAKEAVAFALSPVTPGAAGSLPGSSFDAAAPAWPASSATTDLQANGLTPGATYAYTLTSHHHACFSTSNTFTTPTTFRIEDSRGTGTGSGSTGSGHCSTVQDRSPNPDGGYQCYDITSCDDGTSSRGLVYGC